MIMDNDTRALWEDIRKGVIDINNQQLFFSIVAKGFIYKLNQNLKLRGKNIPHYILNTGDELRRSSLPAISAPQNNAFAGVGTPINEVV